MITLRRCVVVLVCLAGQFAIEAAAQNYPNKPIRYITGGGSAEAIARLVGGGMVQYLGQPLIVDPRPGAGANLGAELAAKSAADGYTLYQPTVSQALNASLYKHLEYNLVRDFIPITQLVTDPAVLVLHPSAAAHSVGELIKLAKAKPGALNYASAGTGTFTYLAAELFKAQAGIDLLHVAYKGGGPAITAVVSGEVPVYFSPLGIALPQIKQGRLRALAVTTITRVPLVPDLPTLNESGLPGYQFGNWYGMAAPARTPQAVLTKVYGAAMSALSNPGLRQRINDLGYVIVGSTPQEFSAHIKAEIQSLAKVVQQLKLTAD